MSAEMGAAIAHLAESFRFAQELNRSVWDFACPLSMLRGLGLTENRCRWLLCNGLALQANEVTQPGDTVRTFHPVDGLVFGREACLVLTPAGADWVATDQEVAEIATIRIDSARVARPHWDGKRRELCVGTVVVKCFRVPAPNQERLLDVFEEEGWPIHIDDPLPSDPALDHKRRLHDTINALNRNQKHRLVQFRGDGRGEGVRWEWLETWD